MPVACLALVALCGLQSATVHAQAWLPLQREGSLSVTFQHINLAGHFDTDGSKFPDAVPSVAHLAIAEFEYGLTDRLAVNVRLPFVAW